MITPAAREGMRRTAWTAALFALFGVCAFYAPGGRAADPKPPLQLIETGFCGLKTLNPDEAKELATPLLSPEGKLGYVATRNILIIHDYPDRIEAVKKIIADVDADPVNIRVEVSFTEAGESSVRGGGLDSGGVVIRSGDGRTRVVGGGTVSFRDNSNTRSGQSTQFVLTGNNRAAKIWVGKSVPDPAWVFRRGCERGWWQQDVVWQDLGASLWVRPRLLGNGLIEVEVFPKVTFRGQAERSVEVREVASRAVVADGHPGWACPR